MRALFVSLGLCACATAPQTPRETGSQLVLHCQPADAEVVLDSVPYARCKDVEDRPIKLAKGLRHVEVRKAEHQQYETWLDTDGTQAALNVSLSKNAVTEAGGNP
ncbi:MAG: hypothetical protein QM723_39825 [Myxococcaceae bacterium]